MSKQLAVIFSIAILLTVSVVASVDLSQTADAAKAKGTPTPKYGSATKSLVCGDKLCSATDKKSETIDSASMTPKSSMNIHAMMDRMDRIHEKHQQHMIQSWNSMTSNEQSVMYQKMQQMMTKMESMDMAQHMKMMSNMMGEKGHSKNMHADSDEKHKTAKHDAMKHPEKMRTGDTELQKYKIAEKLAAQHLETFDNLDFDVFTNQKWDRLHESHSQDIVVHWPDGRTTVGIEPHIEDLKAMFVWAPDTRIEQHPIRIASGPWTSVIGIIEGTFTEPMPLLDGTVAQPTGKSFKLTMNTVGYWENGVMTEEYLFWDNLEFMKQIGLT